MRYAFLLLLGVAACDHAIAGPVAAAIAFKLDPSTCLDMGTPNDGIRLYVDGVYRGTQGMKIGVPSQPITVSPGLHTASAREDFLNSYQWPTVQFTVADGTTQTVLLRC